MPQPLSLAAVVEQLTSLVDATVPLVSTAPGRQHGALIHPDYGIDDAALTGTASLVLAALALHLAPGRRHGDAALLDLVDNACAYWQRVQRPTGRIDLRSCNYDSGPDTAFGVQALCVAIAAIRPAAQRDGRLAATLARLEAVARIQARGLVDGGFHTPNHRWVVASALTQAAALWNDLAAELVPVRDAYLAETPDIDEEGFFIERSIAVYDAICDRSLLLVDELHPWPAGRAAALANLATAIDLLHPDGTAETGLSHRQDHGTRVIPGGLLPVLLQAARLTGDARWSACAGWLWERSGTLKLVDGAYAVFELLAGAPAVAAATPPPVARFQPRNRLWRVREGAYSLSVFGETTHLGSLVWGAATLSQISAGQSCMGHGRFLPEAMSGGPDGVVLHCAGILWHTPPGYWQPIGQPVAKDDFTASLSLDRRTLRRVPPPATRIECSRQGTTLTMRYVGESGLDDVTAQMAFDFPAGGVWETADTCLATAPGQIIFLRRGSGTMRFGSDAITIDGGADAHRTWRMRDIPPVPAGLCRVLIPLRTPLDHTVTISCGH